MGKMPEAQNFLIPPRNYINVKKVKVKVSHNIRSVGAAGLESNGILGKNSK